MSDDRTFLQKVGIAPSEGRSSANDYALDYDWNGMYNAVSQESDNVVEAWWNASNTADRDFARQMVAQQYQNEYLSAPNQMALAKKAGINPNTAAGQILRGSAPSMSAPTTDAPEPLSGASSALGALAGVPEQLANASNLASQSERTRVMLPAELSNLVANTSLSLEGIGLTRSQAQALSIENFYKPQELMLDIAQKKLNLPILRQQLKNLRATYSLDIANAKKALQDIEESKGRVDLMTYQKSLFSAQSSYYSQLSNYVGAQFQLLRDFRWDPSTGLGGLIAGQFIDFAGASDYDEPFNDDVVDAILDVLYRINLNTSKGSAEGSLDAELIKGKGLIKAQEDADRRLGAVQRNDQFRKDLVNKWVRVPSSASVGPFKMSTE